MKRKPEVRIWVRLNKGTDGIERIHDAQAVRGDLDPLHPDCETRDLLCVPADPHAKLKADVVKAAVERAAALAAWEASSANASFAQRYAAADQRLEAAVSKLQKVKP